MDLDPVIATDLENEAKVYKALESLPDKAVLELMPGEIAKYTVVRVGDEICVDLMASASGKRSDHPHSRRCSHSIRLSQITLPDEGKDSPRKGPGRSPIPPRELRRGDFRHEWSSLSSWQRFLQKTPVSFAGNGRYDFSSRLKTYFDEEVKLAWLAPFLILEDLIQLMVERSFSPTFSIG